MRTSWAELGGAGPKWPLWDPKWVTGSGHRLPVIRLAATNYNNTTCAKSKKQLIPR